MEISQILESLNQEFPVPSEAIQAALAQQAEITPVLLDRLARLADKPSIAYYNNKSYLTGIYLLAQFKEKQAFPDILQLASLSEEWIEEFFGDVISEALPSLIVSTYNGDLQAIKSLIGNKDANVWCRSAALHSLLGLFATNHLSREEVIAYYRTLLRSDLIEREDLFVTLLAYDIWRLYPIELQKELIELFDKNLIDVRFFGDKEAIEEQLALDMQECLKKEIYADKYLLPMTDIATEITWLYREPGPEEEAKDDEEDSCKDGCCMLEPGDNEFKFDQKAVTKIGRNDFCPCDSGKKYKKCCLELDTNNESNLETTITKYPATCFGPASKESGLGSIFVVRQLADNKFTVGIYLIDFWCLGVKNTDLKMNMSFIGVQNLLQVYADSAQSLTEYSYEDARSAILGSIRYAASLGFDPHVGWDQVKFLIEPDRQFEDNVVFGRDGKPFYVAGPNDEEIAKSVISKVERVGGNWVTEW